MNQKIDFVIPWVDGDDKNWQALRQENADLYSTDGLSDNSINRFRDWGLLHYWFRGVEKYCPWVNTIFFVTIGHVPPWLNLEHPKLRVIKHADYLPPEYQPCFSSHPIELNFHRIPELSNKFVYFNEITYT